MAAFDWLLCQLSEYWSIQTKLGSLQYCIIVNIRRENNCDYNTIQYWLFHLIIRFYTKWRIYVFFSWCFNLYFTPYLKHVKKLELIRVNDWSTDLYFTTYQPSIGYLKPKRILDWRIILYLWVNIVLIIFFRLTKIPISK